MKLYTAILSLLVLSMLSVGAMAQTTASATAVIVDECSDCKNYKSSRVFLVDSADRKFGFELKVFEDVAKKTDSTEGAAKKEWKAQINIYSYGKSLQYLAARDSSPFVEKEQFRFIVDGGKDLKIESKYYFFLREHFIDGDLRSFRSFFPQIKDGKVVDEKGAGVDGILGEMVISDISLASLQGLGNAKSLEIKAGGEKFKLGAEYLAEIKGLSKNVAAK